MTTSNDPGAPRSLFAETTTLLTREECQAIANKILSFATADETRISINSSAEGNMRFAVNQASTSGDNYDNDPYQYSYKDKVYLTYTGEDGYVYYKEYAAGEEEDDGY